MSDYMFLLESHLSGEQHRVVDQVRGVADHAGLSLFLTGGAMRDILGGFPVRDLDFTTEGSPGRLSAPLAKKFGAKLLSKDDRTKTFHFKFPEGVPAEIAMARSERFAKSGGRPQISPATIHEDLERRDFTINAVGLSLNPASLGLLIDPTNGVGDIERRELRTIHNYSFYDDPVRILRMFRFKARLGFEIEERTRMQFNNAREAGMLDKINAAALGGELRNMAREPSPHDLIKGLEEEGLLRLYSPALEGSKLDYTALGKLQRAYQMIPSGFDFAIDHLPLFLEVLLANLAPKERAAFAKAAAVSRSELAAAQRLGPAAKKLERNLKAAKLTKPSLLYQLLSKVPGERILYLSIHSGQRIVQDRIKNYFQKYLPTSFEITDDMVAATGVKPGTPKFRKTKEEMILSRLDARPKKVAAPPEPSPPPASGFARGPGRRAAS